MVVDVLSGGIRWLFIVVVCFQCSQSLELGLKSGVFEMGLNWPVVW